MPYDDYKDPEYINNEKIKKILKGDIFLIFDVAKSGDLAKLTEILKLPRSSVDDTSSVYNRSLLMISALHQHKDICQLLLDKGADITRKDGFHLTVVDLLDLCIAKVERDTQKQKEILSKVNLSPVHLSPQHIWNQMIPQGVDRSGNGVKIWKEIREMILKKQSEPPSASEQK